MFVFICLSQIDQKPLKHIIPTILAHLSDSSSGLLIKSSNNMKNRYGYHFVINLLIQNDVHVRHLRGIVPKE